MDHDSQQSDPAGDEAFKDALRANLPRERAPDLLRQRIVAALAAESGQSTVMPPSLGRLRMTGSVSWWHAKPIYRQTLATAAVLMIGAAVMWLNRDTKTAIANNAPLPATLASTIVERHELCGVDHQHQMFDVPIGDLPLLRKKFQTQLKDPVVIDVLDSGWAYAGGRFCPVGKAMAAHLMFYKGGESLSILTFAAPPATVAGTYEEQADGTHAIAGWVEGDRMVCCVVSGSLGKDLTEAHHIRDLVIKQSSATQTASAQAASARTASAQPASARTASMKTFLPDFRLIATAHSN